MKYLISLVTLFLFISCANEETSRVPTAELQEISVNVDEVVDELKMSDYFSGLSYVPLKSPEGVPIGRIRKFIINEDRLAFYDEAANRVWVYSKSGQYQNHVTIPLGRGPGEIIRMNDVIVDESGLIHAFGEFKIVVYNLDGEYVRETNFDFFIYAFTYLENDDLYVGYAGNSLNTQMNNSHAGHNLLFFDSNGRVVDSAIPIPNGREHMKAGVPNKFPTYEDETLFFPHLSDTVYTVESGSSVPRYLLDYGDQSIPEEVFSRRKNYSDVVYEWREFREKEIMDNNYVRYLFFFNETNRYIHFRISTASDQYNVIYDKKSGKSTVGPRKLTNDIDFAYQPFFYESSDTALYTVIEAGDLIRELNHLYENEPVKYRHPNSQNLIKIAQKISENSNPVLQIATFKE